LASRQMAAEQVWSGFVTSRRLQDNQPGIVWTTSSSMIQQGVRRTTGPVDHLAHRLERRGTFPRANNARTNIGHLTASVVQLVRTSSIMRVVMSSSPD